jgi:hypothetical protein
MQSYICKKCENLKPETAFKSVKACKLIKGYRPICLQCRAEALEGRIKRNRQFQHEYYVSVTKPMRDEVRKYHDNRRLKHNPTPMRQHEKTLDEKAKEIERDNRMVRKTNPKKFKNITFEEIEFALRFMRSEISCSQFTVALYGKEQNAYITLGCLLKAACRNGMISEIVLNKPTE